MRGCKSSQVRVHGRVVRNDNRFRAGGQDGTIAKAGLSWTPKCYSLSAKKLHKIKLCHNDFSSTQAPIALFNIFFFQRFFLFVFFVCNFLFLKTNYLHNSGTIRCSFYCFFFFSLMSFDTAALKNESFTVQLELVAAISLPGKQKREVQENSFLQVGSKMIDGVEHPKAAMLYVTRWWSLDQS